MFNRKTVRIENNNQTRANAERTSIQNGKITKQLVFLNNLTDSNLPGHFFSLKTLIEKNKSLKTSLQPVKHRG